MNKKNKTFNKYANFSSLPASVIMNLSENDR